MDRSRSASLSPAELYAAIGTAAAPSVVDARGATAFAADARMIVSARRLPGEAAAWGAALPAGAAVVVYCEDGGAASRDAAAALRAGGIAARHLAGGIAGWLGAGLPTRRERGVAGRAWVTRERPRIDRIACPWLVRRFVDPAAAFLYVPSARVFDVAREEDAIAYDIPGAEPFCHVGELCSFDAFLQVYGIADPALDALAIIVRGADTDRLELSPQSPGLLAVSLGLAANFADDHAMLAQGMAIYDALYAWCRLPTAPAKAG